jgi:hypothetical protein
MLAVVIAISKEVGGQVPLTYKLITFSISRSDFQMNGPESFYPNGRMRVIYQECFGMDQFASWT